MLAYPMGLSPYRPCIENKNNSKGVNSGYAMSCSPPQAARGPKGPIITRFSTAPEPLRRLYSRCCTLRAGLYTQRRRKLC
ncbi:hypothetical protein EVAR_67258_1 [Eumeta japonica]|uniref:Uncharacterized protein n=1 Tax=Eumeta variegata TaxID=151549 RepID=A0A4C1SVA8_EUMVA|nr:hypothetical protein EVAR_67258_1 [Eumeta japonica]